jgi:putative flippase GtrA
MVSMSKIVRRQQVKYLIAGAITAVLHFVLFSGGWLMLRHVVPYPLVAVGAQALTVLAVYPAYRVVVFHATGPWIAGLIRFYIACVAVLLLSVVSLVSLVEVARLPVPVAQIVTALWSPVVAYPVQRFWTFRASLRVSTSYPVGKHSQKEAVSAGPRARP